MTHTHNTHVKLYANFFETIDKNTSIEEYEKIFDKEVRFKDPFHDIKGVDKLYKIFDDMYLKLDNPTFKVSEIVEQNNIAYLKWDFHFSFKGSHQEESFEGVSRVEFNEQHKVISHIDYWDASSNLYEKIPILSFFMRFIKKKINN
ncbi:MAG: nuclear transport factor 2 family protein [Arcobacteraceae bacterium]